MRVETLALSIPIITIVMGVGTGMIAILAKYRSKKNMFELYHQERMAAIEKGVELPPLPEGFFQENGDSSRRSSHRTLLWGLILVFIGLTLWLALEFTGNGDKSPYALIPGGVGAAFLIYYFTVGRKLAQAAEEERKARLAEASQAGKP